MKRFDTYQERLSSGPPGFSPGQSAPLPTLSRYSRKPVVPQPTSHTPRPSPNSSTNPRKKARGSRALQSLRDRWRPHPSLWQPVSATQLPPSLRRPITGWRFARQITRGRDGRSAAVAVVIGRHAQALGRRGRIQRLLVPLLVQLLRRARRRRCPRRAASSCARRAAPLGSGHVAPPLDLFLRGKDPISVQCLACGGAPKSTRSGCWLCSASLLCRCVPLTADSSGKSLSSPLTRRAVVHVKFTSITGDGDAPRANKASDDKLKTPAGDRLRASCRSPYNSGFGNQVASYCGSRRPLRTSAG